MESWSSNSIAISNQATTVVSVDRRWDVQTIDGSTLVALAVIFGMTYGLTAITLAAIRNNARLKASLKDDVDSCGIDIEASPNANPETPDGQDG
jgi:hypothetical protein